MKRGWQWLYPILAIALLVLAWLGPLDRLAEDQAQAGLKRALATFATARALNGIISVAQGTEVAVEPGGVGVTFAPGQVLDPINDLLEQFSTLMLTASVSFAAQSAMVAMGSHWIMSALLSLAMVIWLLWSRIRHESAPLAIGRVLVLLLVSRPSMAALALTVDAPLGADLEFGPGMGWGETKKFEFNLPGDATAANLSQLAGFFNSQTGGNKALFSKPLVFRFQTKQPGFFRVRLGTLAKGGASIKIFVNGSQQVSKSWPASNNDHGLNESLEASFSAGPVEIRMESAGPDWVVMQSFSVGGISPMVRGYGCGDGSCSVVRLTAAPGAKLPASVGVAGLGLKDGQYSVARRNLDTGEEVLGKATIRNGALTERLQVKEGDVALIILSNR